MSKIKLTGHASGTGVLEITAPNTSTDRTITLPDSTGTLATTADSVGGANGVDFNDNVKARFGTGNDLEIYHDGTHSYIKDVGTGDLRIKGTDLSLRSDSADEPYINCTENGSVSVFHNNSKKLETTATGVTVTGSVDGADNLVEEVASGSTAALSHDGTASATVYAVTGTHTTYLVTASANSSITNVVALVSIGTSTSTMRITNLSGSYNTTVTGSGSNIQVTCAYGSSLVYQYRVIQLR
jgi:hypothetical protein